MTVERVGPFQLLILALSLYVLVALGIEGVFPVSQQTSRILSFADAFICVIFLADFFVRLFRSSDKAAFLRWGWIDFISSIPTLDVLRWGRLVRVARILRLLRGVRSLRIIWQTLFADRARGALATVAFGTFMLITFSSIGILYVENDPDSNIKEPGEALWWAVVTVTTVGYGDRFPMTAEGRILGVLLMTAGVGLFGVLTACLATWFMEPNAGKKGIALENIHAELVALRDEVRNQSRNIGKSAGSGAS